MQLIRLSAVFTTVFTLLLPSSNAVDTNPPLNYGVIVFPAFQYLDIAGPLDFLNMLSLAYPLNLNIVASTLDPVSTRPVSAAMNKFNSNFSEQIVPTHTFANPPEDLDVLIVPGGLGTRAPAPALLDAIQYIKDVYPKLQYLITVCTGATLAARAGVLDGKRATTNKRSWTWATSQGPNVTWIPVARWVVDGNIWSTSGVAAGMDGTLAFVEHVYGSEVAWAYANGSEYDWHNDSSWDPFSALFNVTG